MAGTTTSLAPIQTRQPMDTPSMLSPTSPEAPTKLIEHSRYCMICTPLAKTCQKNSLNHQIGMMIRKKKTKLKVKTKIKKGEEDTLNQPQILCSDYLNSTAIQTLHHSTFQQEVQCKP